MNISRLNLPKDFLDKWFVFETPQGEYKEGRIFAISPLENKVDIDCGDERWNNVPMSKLIREINTRSVK